MIGTLVANKYRVKRRIGAGGMGAVYEGEHVEIGKRVAIKVIEGEHARSPELAARFKREARAASAVESEHILHVFDVGSDDAIGLYMVMEYLVGEDVASRLEKNGGKLPVDDAVTIALQASRGLTKAHAAGVVHRDLKPANLFLTEREDGTTCVKILDFGISKLVRPDADQKQSSLTREGSVMGTPMYMSPQQAQGMTVDHRTDVWSLGALVYEMLAGRPPYEAKDTYEMMIVQIVTKPVVPLAEAAPWVPGAIAEVVDRALVHDVDARMPDAASFTKALAAAAKVPAPSSRNLGANVDPVGQTVALASAKQTVAMAASTPTPVGHAPPPTAAGVVVATGAPSPSRGPAIAIVGILGVLAVIGIVVVAMKSSGGERTPAPGSAGLVPAASTSMTTIATPSAVPTTPLPDLSAEPPPAASAAPSSPPAPSQKPIAKVPAMKPQAPPAKPAGTQYGGAGLDTTYK